MSLDRSWQFVGRNDALPYRVFDALRRRLNKRLVRYLLSVLEKSSSSSGPLRVLEPGCGTGFAVAIMHDHPGVGLAAALDVDESALREAKKRNPQLSAVVGDLFQLPFQDNAFDLVFNSSTVEHLDDPGAAVCEMQRVCQQGGHVFVGVPYSLGPLAIQRAICNTRLGIWLGPVFTPRSLRTLLRQAQLEPIDSITYFWRFFVGVIARRRLVTTGAGA